VLLESSHDGPLPQRNSFASVEPDNLVLGALKLADDGEDLIVRAVETAGRAVAARIDLPGWGREIRFDAGPFDIRTFRVPRDEALPVVETDLLERPTAPPSAQPDPSGNGRVHRNRVATSTSG
jgi:alpha-mannosidase